MSDKLRNNEDNHVDDYANEEETAEFYKSENQKLEFSEAFGEEPEEA